jgi:outer membrane biosynthesis protein TonB
VDDAFTMEEEDKPRSKWPMMLVGVGLAVGGYAFYSSMSSGGDSGHREAPPAPIRIQLPPPPPSPPPPPPPPPQAPPPEQKMIEQAPVEAEEPKAEPAPAEEAPAIGTNISGNGPADGFGLGRAGGEGRGTGRIGGGSRGPASKWGWYAGKVQSRIGQAMKNHPRVRSAEMDLTVRVWSDSGGRISRVQLVGSTGDTGLDGALRDEVLSGLQLQDAPPEGMPMPITMRLRARKP